MDLLRRMTSVRVLTSNYEGSFKLLAITVAMKFFYFILFLFQVITATTSQEAGSEYLSIINGI